MLFLAEADVRRLLPMDQAIELLEEGFVHLASGQAQNQPRRRLQLDSSAMLHYMAAVDIVSGFLGIKVYSTHPSAGAHFLLLLFSAGGPLLAVIEANALGQIRTGAATAVATRRLAREEASCVGLIGSGFQARTQLEAVAKARRITEVRVFSRTADHRRQFADEMSAALRLAIRPVDSAEEAVRGCDIVITATSARDPVLLGDWLAPGAHINAVGSNHARRRELDAAAVARSSLIVVDSLEQARLESGDLIAAFGSEDRRWDQVTELADLVAGKVAGRRRPEEITLFKSNGIALEDIAAAGYLYQQALREKP